MSEFTASYELRRIIFGLTAILETPEESMPPFILDVMDDMFEHITRLARKMYE